MALALGPFRLVAVAAPALRFANRPSIAARALVPILLAAPLLLLLVGSVAPPDSALFMAAVDMVALGEAETSKLSANGVVNRIVIGTAPKLIDWLGVMLVIWSVGSLLGLICLGRDLFRLRQHFKGLQELPDSDAAKLKVDVATHLLYCMSVINACSFYFCTRLPTVPCNRIAETPSAQLDCIVWHEESHLCPRYVQFMDWRYGSEIA